MNDQNPGGFVSTEKTDDGQGATTVIVTDQGATAHPCPGGLTEDELLD
ncbi:hypothetical protein [Streptomyces rugosispiralis]|uniref:Uncharacterized protein n=1 Tax=Streptomyces rugosispiralis TaxID=2967341 RepID=A0ABT1VBJ1_9ACTN|nr:hypothetical protein [Streptomyces rugosispiralis]MCQ8194647.1 hypothetical protein [Streptomyces rugosispiralis]